MKARIIPSNNPQPTINEVYCDKCKTEFSITSVGIKEANVELDNEQYVLVYFVCPKCNQIYRICLKDKRYNELAEDLENTKKRIAKQNRKQNIELADKLDSMVRIKTNRLKVYTKNLNRKFPGTFTFVMSENNSKEKVIKYLP